MLSATLLRLGLFSEESMSRLLEILGRAITVDTADLIWHWFGAVKLYEVNHESAKSDHLDKIIALVADMKIEAAQEQLRLYLFDNPSCTHGRLAAAAICLQNNQIDGAIEELNSVYMRQPNNTMALYALGYCYERLGREAEAVQFYQDCLKFTNHLQLPRQRLAAIYFKNGQLEKTIQEYELLAAEYPDDISTLVALGHLYIANTRYDLAVKTFNTAILIHPDSFYHQEDQVEQLIRDGLLDEALERLEDLTAEHSERVDLLVQRADVLAMLGATTEATSLYQEALQLCPDYLEATIKLGTQYLQMGQECSAAQQFNKAVEINDQIVDAYTGLALAQKLAGDLEQALITLSLGAAIDANSSLLFTETATLQFKVASGGTSVSHEHGDMANLIKRVIIAHEDEITRRPHNPELYYRLGILLMGIADHAKAINSFGEAIRINPTHTRAKTKLAVCLYETNHKQEALEQLTVPGSLNKDTLALHYKVALLYCDRIKFASSMLNLEHALENNFAQTDASVNISVVLQNLGLLDRAAAMWENLADMAADATRPNRT